MNSSYPELLPGLTIAIPTYNRPRALARTLEIIIPQVLANPNVYLDLHDNCSPEIPACFGDPRLVDHPRVRLMRNRYNESYQNVMKCFVACETEWLWVLGDDDLPSENAVDIIFAKMSAGCGYMTFKIPSAKALVKLENDIAGEGLEKLFDLFEHRFMKMICLSTSIYSMQHIREHIGVASVHVYAAAPHTLMAFLAIEKGMRWLCSKDCICDYNIPEAGERWSRFLIYNGLPSFIPALKLESSRKLARKAISREWASKPQKFLPHIEQYFGGQRGDIHQSFSLIRMSYSPRFRERPLKALRWILIQWRLNLRALFK